MKQRSKITFFWSGLTALISLFGLALLWSVIPLGGETLPHVLEQLLSVSFASSAMLVALLCALLAAVTMGLMMLHPTSEPADNAEHVGLFGFSDHQGLARKRCSKMKVKSTRPDPIGPIKMKSIANLGSM